MQHDADAAFVSAEMQVVVRRALASDQAGIEALVRSEPLNPNGLHWHRFVVTSDAQGLVGAAQLCHNGDGSHELASLVVRPRGRGHGIAAQMIDLLVDGRRGRVFAVTRRANVPRFARWGFVEIDASDAAREVRTRRMIGQLASVVSLLRGRRPSALVVLERVPPTQPAQTKRNATLPSGP
jgi:N-acetylglutamate synthase-like GNAT family acetyltransferase